MFKYNMEVINGRHRFRMMATILQSLLLCVLFFLYLNPQLAYVTAQPSDAMDVDVSADVSPALSLSISGVSNEFGRLTFLIGNAINFGDVNFVHPEQISNGDAYRVGEILRLEAVLQAALMFNGVSFVDLEISRFVSLGNPFAEIYLSTSVSRSSTESPLFRFPRANSIKRVDVPEDVLFRVLFDVTPKHHGTISERLVLSATAM